MTPGILYPVAASSAVPQLALPLAATCAACGGATRPMVDAFTGGLLDVCTASGCGQVRRVPRIRGPVIATRAGTSVVIDKPKCPHCHQVRTMCYRHPCPTRVESQRKSAAERDRKRARKRQDAITAKKRATREANRSRRLAKLRDYWRERATQFWFGGVA